MKRLHTVFEGTAKFLYDRRRGSGTSDNATPFDNVLPDDASDSPINAKSPVDSTFEMKSSVNLDTLGRANLRAVSRMGELYMNETLVDVEIPDAFNEMVFDAAENEIKYLVLTNTWPKFVSAGRANSQLSREDDEEKGNILVRVLLCDK
jgi:hypothetical protein